MMSRLVLGSLVFVVTGAALQGCSSSSSSGTPSATDASNSGVDSVGTLN